MSAVPVGAAAVGIVVEFAALLLSGSIWSLGEGFWALDTAGGDKRHILITKNISQKKPHSEASVQYSLQGEQRAVLFIPVTLSNNAVMFSRQRVRECVWPLNMQGRVCHSIRPVSEAVRNSYKEVALTKPLATTELDCCVCDRRTVRPLSVYSLSTFLLMLRLYKTSTFFCYCCDSRHFNEPKWGDLADLLADIKFWCFYWLDENLNFTYNFS